MFPNISLTPIWAFHADNDEIVDYSTSKEAVKALKVKVLFTNVEGGGHVIDHRVFEEYPTADWLFGDIDPTQT